MDFELSEDTVNGIIHAGTRLAIIGVILYLVWIAFLQGFFNSIEAGMKKDALAKGDIYAKQICSDIDSLRKLQQDPNSQNPSVLRIKELIGNYKTVTAVEFNESACKG